LCGATSLDAPLPPPFPAVRLSADLLQSAPPERVNALAFPSGYSEVFATAAPGGVRVWHLDSGRELLRVTVPNLECKCLVFAVVSGPRGVAAGRAGERGAWHTE
jgi:hypothetical protein